MPNQTVRVVIVCLALATVARAQDQGRGLILNDKAAFSGFTLFTPLGAQATYLIDMQGHVVHSWKSRYMPANSAYLLPNGNLLRCAKFMDNQVFGNRGPSGGRVELFSWDGKLLWDFLFSSDQHHQHHDIEPMPNGNVLILAWERKTVEQAIEAGRAADTLSEQGIFPDKIVEVKRTGPTTGEVVWEWHMWDHLVQDANPQKRNYANVAEHPELVDINLNARPRPDWMHTNSVAYNPELDQIVISVRSFNEIFVIDHSTTTEEAAGHAGGRAGKGGDILYRWGNPANYRAGSEADRQLFVQHDARWIRTGRPGGGHITIFNNGRGRPDGDWSSIEEIVPPIQPNGSYHIDLGSAFAPSEPVWSYSATSKQDFYSSFISGAERLPNGNTLICSGASGIFFEVTQAGQTVWEYHNPFASMPSGNRRELEANRARPGQPERPRQPDDEGRRNNRERRGEPAPAGQNPTAGRGGPPSPHIVFRVVRYARDYPGLAGRLLAGQSTDE